jgi:GWxTD domain-containing protein
VSAVLEKRSFELPPGAYELRVAVADLNSQQTSKAGERVTIPDYSRVPVGFVELELGVSAADGEFLPVPTRRYGLNIRRLAARVALFDRRDGPWPRSYPFGYRILDETGAPVLSGRREATLERSGAAVVIVPDSSDLFVGSYVMEVELAEGRSRWRVERGFEVEESGPPRGREFERVLEPLAYIAEPEEIDHLGHLPPEEQERGWEGFWKRRDPTPETPKNEALLEFMRRLRYTEQHFQTFGPGWRTDMGRIYIKFGQPDQIETRPATLASPTLEIWYYNQSHRRFVFADREGFGRYTLVSPVLE